MKFLKYAAILPIAFSCMGLAQAKGDIFYTAPFRNVEVKAASKIYVDYSFDSHKQTLVCTSDQASDAITSIEFSYKDATRKIELPVTLIDDSHFQDHDTHFADPEGKLIITNDFGYQAGGSIFVSCEYRNMK